jgi:diguanylate cyclase (GGDEF)-like protein/PAS domain S-box-containing protein
MVTVHWETLLARRLALITIIGGLASWLLRQYRLGASFDFLTFFLGAYIVVLGVMLWLKTRHQLLIPTMILAMVVIGLWVCVNLGRVRPVPLLIIQTAITLAAAYYRLLASLVLIAISSFAMVFTGFWAQKHGITGAGELPAGMTIFVSWLSTSIGFATVSTIIAALVSFIVGKMTDSLLHSHNLLQKVKADQHLLIEKEQLLTLFTELSSDYVYRINLEKPNLVPEVFAGSFERITGYTLKELEAKGGWLKIVNPEDRLRLERLIPALLDNESSITEYRITSRAGKTVWLRDHIRPVKDEKSGGVTHLLGAVHDITERRAAEEQVQNLAFYDPLTALPNRRLLLDRLEQAMALSARTFLRGALLFIDLDHFKNLNDTKGHEAGDQLLVQQARRLKLCVREGDTVARLGGDEFIIVLGELAEDQQKAADEATEIAQRILHALSLPVALSHRTMSDYENTCSIGLTMFQGHEVTIDELLRRADLAMYQSKNDGRNTFRFYDPEMQKLLSERLTLEEDLKIALAHGQLQLYLQPQFSKNRQLLGAEVLLRWLHPEKGMISPLQFIPAAERTGLIVELGNWVLEESCKILRSWSDMPVARDLQLAVNVSARQFKQDDFVKQVGKCLTRTGADGTRLKLELTESLAVDSVERTAERMREFKNLGVGLSLDDFGTGQSSLSYLKLLPLSQLKIDQSFVRDITTDPNDAVLVQTIIGMARNLNLDIIAEGVETEEQFNFLVEHGCLAFQGFLLGRPMPYVEFAAQFLK